MLIALIKGIAIGFSLAVPVGPIGILCIRRTLTEGRRSALSTMFGAASADAIYGTVAVFGVTLVSDFIAHQVHLIRLIGGVILIVLGIRMFRTLIPGSPPRLSLNDHAGNFVSTFVLTLMNPLTFFAFAAVFAGGGTIEEASTTVTAALLVGGVFLGSMLWFGCLSAAAHFFRSALDTSGLLLINRIAGTVITLLGIGALASLLR